MRAPYRTQVSEDLWWILCTFFAVGSSALSIWLVISLKLEHTWPNITLMALVPPSTLVLGIVVGAKYIKRRRNQRTGRIAAALAPRGLQVDTDPTKSQRTNQFRDLDALLRGIYFLVGGANDAGWLAYEANRPGAASSGLWVCEHKHLIGAGKHANLIEYTIIIWNAEHPAVPAQLAAAPIVVLAKFGGWVRRSYAKSEIVNPDPAHWPDWAWYGHSSTAVRFAGEAGFRAALAHVQNDTIWQIGNGKIVCMVRGDFDAAGIAAFLDHAKLALQALRQAVEPTAGSTGPAA